eukprot:4377505-Pleurochrysis_carterae.AAC.5
MALELVRPTLTDMHSQCFNVTDDTSLDENASRSTALKGFREEQALRMDILKDCLNDWYILSNASPA